MDKSHPPAPPSKGDILAKHMHRIYRRWYQADDYGPLLRSKKERHTLVRHVVRARLAELHGAGPSTVARAEHKLRSGPGPNHSTILHSVEVAEEVLPGYRPALVRRVERLIEKTNNFNAKEVNYGESKNT